MKFAFVDHSYHAKTLSTKWLLDLIEPHGDVDVVFDDSWQGGEAPDFTKILDYDRVYVFQMDQAALYFAERIPEKLVFVPMYDNARSLRAKTWARFGAARILCLSSTLHEHLRRLGLNSYYAQYFPDPSLYPQVDDFSTLRGYLWQRTPRIGWDQVARLTPTRHWDSFTLHLGLDPPHEKVALPTNAEIHRQNIRITHFSPDPEIAKRAQAEANVYFAPREYEGIGMAFLEAMARGQCVVAPQNPTLSEYIANRVNGLLYDPLKLKPVPLDDAAEMGRAARRHIENGFADWSADKVTRLPEILLSDASALAAPRTFAQACASNFAISERPRRAPAQPKVSVAIACLNAAESFEETLASICSQDFDDLEIVVVDGGSTDGTLDIIERHKSRFAKFVSEADRGPFDAMNKAARLASGEYILYMNCGDAFASPSSVRRAFAAAPDDADFIIGNHVYLTTDHVEELHWTPSFDHTWEKLRDGQLTRGWHRGIPCHQATFTRRTLLLKEGGYSRKLNIAADHGFLFRMKKRGAKVFHCGETIAIYAGGGFSQNNITACFEEWRQIWLKYGVKKNVDSFLKKTCPRQLWPDSLKNRRDRIMGKVLRSGSIFRRIADAFCAAVKVLAEGLCTTARAIRQLGERSNLLQKLADRLEAAGESIYNRALTFADFLAQH
jgi:glycosyltransferase involved in cell wall biosynthesis